MAGVNKVILVGNIGKIEIKETKMGDKVVNLSIATSSKWKDKDGVQQEITEWHNCVAFKKTADVIAQYCAKGSKVYVEGSLKTEKWQTKEGENRYTTKIIVNQVQMLSPKSEGEAKEASSKDYSKAKETPASSFQEMDKSVEFDDSIPF